MRVGYRWSGHIFWNWYARHLDAVDVGNLQRIAILDKQLGDYQVRASLKRKSRRKILLLFAARHLDASVLRALLLRNSRRTRMLLHTKRVGRRRSLDDKSAPNF